MATSRIKKLSVKTVVGGKGKLLQLAKTAKGSERINIMRVMGTVSGVRTGTGTYGDWVAFQGIFEATNIETGEVTRGRECFIPPVFENEVLAAYNNLDDGAELSFAIDVSLRAVRQEVDGEIEVTGYEYGVTPLIEAAEEADPLGHLRLAMQEKGVLALPSMRPDVVVDETPEDDGKETAAPAGKKGGKK